MGVIIRYMRCSIGSMCLVFVFSMMQVACQLILPTMTDRILRSGVYDGDFSVIGAIGLQMLGITIGVAACMVVSGYFSARATAQVIREIRRDLFGKVTRFTSSEFNHFGTATLLTRCTADVSQVQNMLIIGMRSALIVPFTGIGALIVAVRMNASLTTLVLVAFAAALAVAWAVSRVSRSRFQSLQRSVDRINLLLKEKLTGARAVRAANRQRFEEERLGAAINEAYDNALGANRFICMVTPAMQLIMSLTIVGVYYLGAVQIQYGMVDNAALIKFLQYILMFISSLASVSAILAFIPRVSVSLRRIDEVLSYDSGNSVHNAQTVPSSATEASSLRFEHVSFGYEGSERPVLNDISFDVEPGQTLAIIGATGSGKTTLLQLIVQLFKPTVGRVLIDGVDTAMVDSRQVRAKISYAPQFSRLFSRSIWDNMRLAQSDITREQAEEALSAAQADEFVPNLPERMDTVMEQGGKNVSGGQRQRLSLARALVRDAGIYLLDDTFSALDARTERAALQAVRERLNDKTVVVVAQKINAIRDADRILVLDDGEMVGFGTHDELLRDCRTYREIYDTQYYASKDDGGEE